MPITAVVFLCVGAYLHHRQGPLSAYLHSPPHPPRWTPICSAGAVALLLIWGIRDWLKTRKISPLDMLLATSVAGLALVIRVASDVHMLPARVGNDEFGIATSAVQLSQRWWAILGLYWHQLPTFGLVPVALTYSLFDNTIVNSRLTHGVCGAIAVFALYDLGRVLVSRRVGLAAAGLLSVSFPAIAYARSGHQTVVVSMFAAILMACTARAVAGGSFVTWAGAAVAMGFGIMGYQAGQLLPLAFAASLLPYVLFADSSSDRRRIICFSLFVLLVGVLLAAPPFISAWQVEKGLNTRTSTLLVSADKMQHLANWYQMPNASGADLFLRHAFTGYSLLWTGGDHFYPFSSPFPFLDPFTGILVALTPIFFLRRPKVTWVCVTWIALFLTCGVVLCVEGVTFHRIVTIGVFTSLLAALACDALLPNRFVPFALAFIWIGSAYVNLHRYFVVYPAQYQPWQLQAWVTKQVCPYGASHVIFDASHPEGHRPPWKHMEYLALECKSNHYHYVETDSELWRFGDIPMNKVLVVARTELIKQLGVSPPAGFTVLRTWINEDLKSTSLTFVELEKSH